jgi:NAD(P)H-dependent FMN reductase
VRELPHFDPDLEGAAPETALRFLTACESAPGVLLSVPEYAFGIPAPSRTLSTGRSEVPASIARVTVLEIAPPGRGEAVRTAFGLVLKALDADVVHRWVPVTAADRDASGEIVDPEVACRLGAIVSELAGRASAGIAFRAPLSYRSANAEAAAR